MRNKLFILTILCISTSWAGPLFNQDSKNHVEDQSQLSLDQDSAKEVPLKTKLVFLAKTFLQYKLQDPDLSLVSFLARRLPGWSLKDFQKAISDIYKEQPYCHSDSCISYNELYDMAANICSEDLAKETRFEFYRPYQDPSLIPLVDEIMAEFSRNPTLDLQAFLEQKNMGNLNLLHQVIAGDPSLNFGQKMAVSSMIQKAQSHDSDYIVNVQNPMVALIRKFIKEKAQNPHLLLTPFLKTKNLLLNAGYIHSIARELFSNHSINRDEYGHIYRASKEDDNDYADNTLHSLENCRHHYLQDIPHPLQDIYPPIASTKEPLSNPHHMVTELIQNLFQPGFNFHAFLKDKGLSISMLQNQIKQDPKLSFEEKNKILSALDQSLQTFSQEAISHSPRDGLSHRLQGNVATAAVVLAAIFALYHQSDTVKGYLKKGWNYAKDTVKNLYNEFHSKKDYHYY